MGGDGAATHARDMRIRRRGTNLYFFLNLNFVKWMIAMSITVLPQPSESGVNFTLICPTVSCGTVATERGFSQARYCRHPHPYSHRALVSSTFFPIVTHLV